MCWRVPTCADVCYGRLSATIIGTSTRKRPLKTLLRPVIVDRAIRGARRLLEGYL